MVSFVKCVGPSDMNRWGHQELYTSLAVNVLYVLLPFWKKDRTMRFLCGPHGA